MKNTIYMDLKGVKVMTIVEEDDSAPSFSNVSEKVDAEVKNRLINVVLMKVRMLWVLEYAERTGNAEAREFAR